MLVNVGVGLPLGVGVGVTVGVENKQGNVNAGSKGGTLVSKLSRTFNSNQISVGRGWP